MPRKGKDIKNREELNAWMDERMKSNYSFNSVKGKVDDVYYDDETGDAVLTDVNIAWVCKETGERFDLIWDY